MHANVLQLNRVAILLDDAEGVLARLEPTTTHRAEFGPMGLAHRVAYDLEVKYQEALNIWAALAQACEEAGTNVPVVAFRRNRSEWYAALPFEDLMALLALRDAA